MRNKVIDFLRGIAILLTLFHHFGFSGIYLFDIIKKLGWIGVDLFFVLSGFLVSGLIFDEYRDTNKINQKRKSKTYVLLQYHNLQKNLMEKDF